MKVKTTNKNHDDLYNEALDSLKKLNEEVLLNKLNEDFKDLVKGLKNEIYNFSEELKNDFAFLSGSVNMAATKVKDHSEETKKSIQQNSDFFYEKLKDFSQHFNSSMTKISQFSVEANKALLAEIKKAISIYNESFESINVKHEQLNAQSLQQNQQLSELVNQFSQHIEHSQTLFVNIKEQWLGSIETLTRDLHEEFEQLKGTIDESKQFQHEVKIQLQEEINKLITVNTRLGEQLQNGVDTNEAFKKEWLLTTEQFNQNLAKKNNEYLINLERMMQQLKEDVRQMNEKHYADLHAIVQQLTTENEEQKQQLHTQEALIVSKSKMNVTLQIVTLVGIIALVILHFFG